MITERLSESRLCEWFTFHTLWKYNINCFQIYPVISCFPNKVCLSVPGKRPADQLTICKNESFGGRVLPALDPPREEAADLCRLLLDGTLRRLHPALPPLVPPRLPPSLLQALVIRLALCCLALPWYTILQQARLNKLSSYLLSEVGGKDGPTSGFEVGLFGPISRTSSPSRWSKLRIWTPRGFDKRILKIPLCEYNVACMGENHLIRMAYVQELSFVFPSSRSPLCWCLLLLCHWRNQLLRGKLV